MKEYEILYDTGSARNLVDQISYGERRMDSQINRCFGSTNGCSCCLRFDGARK